MTEKCHSAQRESIDGLDARIILALDDDPDATILSLSRTLGIARNTVHARLRHLAEDGALKPSSSLIRPFLPFCSAVPHYGRTAVTRQ
jgi:DNA-binding Lrp family transcriptional regulator